MKYYIDNQSDVTVDASTVRQAVEAVSERYPQLRFHLFDAQGNLRRHFNLFVNGEHIRERNGMDTPLHPDDKLILMASAAGG